MELELKHIAPYLPYKLRVVEWYRGKQIHDEFVVDCVNWDGKNIGGSDASLDSFELERMFNLKDIKPILRPMSDLYKSINGSVGIVDVGKVFEPNGVLSHEDCRYSFSWSIRVCDDYQCYEIGWVDSVGWFGVFFDDYDYDNQGENFTGDYLRYNRDVFEYLFKNHFDIFGLIDKGLAIAKEA